jgi:tetratricopeptide (TPR) repeat protein
MVLVDTADWQGSTAAAQALFQRASGSSGMAQVMQRMQAALELVDKGQAAALAELNRAADLEETLPFEFGPPATYKPPRELEGEILLRLNRPADAVRAFNQALRRTPARAPTLLGLARASAKNGDAATAAAAYRQLKAIWHRADPGYGPLAEAETYLARHLSERP